MTQQTLDELQTSYNILDDVELMLKGPDQLFSDPPERYVAISAYFLQCRLRLPLQLFFQRLLTTLGIAPRQIVLNTWRVMCGYIALWKEIGFSDLNLEDFLHIYNMKLDPNHSRGFYYTSTYNKKDQVLTKLRNQ